LYDISSGKESLLWERIADSSLEIQKLAWISDSRVLAVLQEGLESSRKTNEIIDLDVNSGNRRTLYHPVYPQNFSYALSPDASLLAFSDGNKRYDIYGRIKILDVQTGAVRLILGNGSNLIGNAFWSPDGSEFAYTEGRDLKIWTVATDSIRTIHTFPDRFVCYHVVFGKGVVGYVGDISGQSHYRESLILLDSKSGANVREIKAPFNGGIFLLDNGGTFVCEIGI